MRFFTGSTTETGPIAAETGRIQKKSRWSFAAGNSASWYAQKDGHHKHLYNRSNSH
jgi:hypothetical protein